MKKRNARKNLPLTQEEVVETQMTVAWAWTDRGSRTRHITQNLTVVLGLKDNTIVLKTFAHPVLGRVCIPGDATYRVVGGALVHCSDDR